MLFRYNRQIGPAEWYVTQAGVRFTGIDSVYNCKSTVVCCLLDMVVGLGLGMLGMPASHAQSSCVYLFVSVVFTLITSLNKSPCYIITDGNACRYVDSDKRRIQCWIY